MVFKDVVEFINMTTNNKQKIDKEKLKNAVNSTLFDKLKDSEQKNGFSEAITSKKDNKKKISFFNLGPKNDWRKILDKDLQIKIGNVFEKEIIELEYK
jgi:hypothetical protein